MRFLASLALLAIGFGAGWTFRDSQPADGPSRAAPQEAARTTEPAVEETPEDLPPAYAPKKGAPTPSAETVAGDSTSLTAPEAKGEDEPEVEQDPEAAKLAKFMRSMLPLLKMQSVSEGRAMARELAELLQLDERREKQLAELFAKDKVRKLEEGLLPMLEGKKPDETMLANMQETDGMTKTLQDEMIRVLNANEMDTVRSHYREQREEARRQAVEAQIKGLAIPDLTTDQERELRAVLTAENEQRANIQNGPTSGAGSGFGMKMTSSLSKDGMVEALDESYREHRERVARFLSTEQLAHLDKRHELDREEAKATAGMMGGLMGAISVGRSEPPKEDG
jgi:hypothetical protein